ncbi:hypothetical protein GCM10010499_32760 [Streptomyces thermoviolaceus subsp. apingens]|nr:hypothetical protein GCM10010499_32760 [Streptomyces thermoviolaceus subsp. apingens]
MAAAHGVLGVGDGPTGAVDVTEAVGGLGGEFDFVEIADPLRLVLVVPAFESLGRRAQSSLAGNDVAGTRKGTGLHRVELCTQCRRGYRRDAHESGTGESNCLGVPPQKSRLMAHR